MQDKLILWFNEIELKDLAQVGGKTLPWVRRAQRRAIDAC